MRRLSEIVLPDTCFKGILVCSTRLEVIFNGVWRREIFRNEKVKAMKLLLVPPQHFLSYKQAKLFLFCCFTDSSKYLGQRNYLSFLQDLHNLKKNLLVYFAPSLHLSFQIFLLYFIFYSPSHSSLFYDATRHNYVFQEGFCSCFYYKHIYFTFLSLVFGATKMLL